MPTNYKVSLTLGDKQYQSKGKTLLEAIDGLKLNTFLKTKGIFTATHGKLKSERLMPITQMKQVFMGSRMSKEVFAKHVSLLFK